MAILDAQEVHKMMSPFNWKAYIASDPDLQYITYTVDGRGTGFKGRAFRSTVTKHLGKLEPIDQVWAAEQLLSMHSYIDPEHVGIYGSSYGGYLSAKTLELDSGVFSFGLIQAPVSDWRFYDSFYTERYNKLLEENEEGYAETAVRNTTGFANAKGGFSVLHGTGDDNVHYQNTAALVELLVDAEGVNAEKFKMFAFTDAVHNIGVSNGGRFLYQFLTERLWEEKNREEEVLVHQWGRRDEEGIVAREWTA